jgi:hypothetical protein
MKRVTFLKGYHRHILDKTKKYDDEEEAELNREIRINGGDYLYEILHSMVVRSNWKDHEGYPIKEKFYDNKILACSISIRKLSSISGISDKKVQKLLNMMEKAGWIIKHKNAVLRGQNVYAIGRYSLKYISEKNEYIYTEILYKNQALDLVIGEYSDTLSDEMINLTTKIKTKNNPL